MLQKKIGLPCIIKSPDSSGSRGVVKVNSLEQVEDAFEEGMKYTRGRKLLVEEFITGIEVGAQGFSVQGQCHMALVHDDILSPPPYMIPVGHAFPSSLERETISGVEKSVKDAVDALGIQTGPSNIDLIIDKNGQARIIEIGARIGATCLPELVYYHTGIDWVKQTIKASIGEYPELIKNKMQPCAAFILEAPEDGIFQGYTIPLEIEKHPDVLEWEVTASIGQTVDRLRKGTDRIGKVVTRGITQKKAIELANKFRDSLSFDIRLN
jgi:biotin carboxylase